MTLPTLPKQKLPAKFGFFGGKRYAYTITVKASGIEVTAAKGGTWNAGGSENVGVTITYDARKQNRKSATITTPTAPGETVACASSMPTARWSGQRPSRSRRTVRTLSPSCSMPVITKTMPPITPPPVSVSRSATLCRCLAGCHKRLLSVGRLRNRVGLLPHGWKRKKTEQLLCT